ncbi:hypothetical protein EYF80_065007 [Liparis tanakae]|uniref:Uncharacterized protein n=1 Tax=Liparis tanakae TaxID=230148 RepID=A0A4Z2E7U4_9TELE|nr:hypothetical protein EYF80_065007 [Liparis tanakae]
MEDLPYLEILCVSDATSGSLEEEGVATESLLRREEQGSLITCAWSKPPMVHTECEGGAAVRETGQSQDEQPGDASRTAEHTPGERDREEGRHTLFHLDFTGHPHAEQQSGAVGQLTLVESTLAAQPKKGESEGDLQSHALAAETLQAARPRLRADTPERRGGDVCPEAMNDAADVDIEVEVEVCPAATGSELWDPRGPEDQTYNTQATFDSSPADGEAMRESTPMEKERAREPVSEMERERTMQSLVDMQRKVERRQQRERERQLLRVRERWRSGGRSTRCSSDHHQSYIWIKTQIITLVALKYLIMVLL